LKRVFELVERKPSRGPCKGINGLVETMADKLSQQAPLASPQHCRRRPGPR
jgi:hypothetical protein